MIKEKDDFICWVGRRGDGSCLSGGLPPIKYNSFDIVFLRPVPNNLAISVQLLVEELRLNAEQKRNNNKHLPFSSGVNIPEIKYFAVNNGLNSVHCNLYTAKVLAVRCD